MVEKLKQDKQKKKVYTSVVNFDEVVRFIPKGYDQQRNATYNLSVNGQELTPQELHSLVAEGVIFQNSRLYKILTNTIRQAAIDKVLHNTGKDGQSDSERLADEHIGRAMIAALDLIENIVYTLHQQKTK